MKRAALLLLACVALASLAAGLAGRARPPTETGPAAISFQDAEGRPVDLARFRGKVALIDFWATWCQPCRKEMPQFDRLQARYGDRGLVVVPVAIDFAGLPAVDRFYAEVGVRNLGKYVDDTRESARKLGFLGIPGLIAFDRQGREVFRVEGELNWDGPGPRARIEALLRE
jgi:thiol-disulfide isomerase/thioredoxin